jgi:hypothetical protein
MERLQHVGIFGYGRRDAQLDLTVTLQRYLIRRRLHTLFSVRQKGAVVALLPSSYQVEDVLKRQSF